MELFVVLVDGFQPLYNFKKRARYWLGSRTASTFYYYYYTIIIIIITNAIVINIIFITFIITRTFEQEQFTVLLR